MINEENLHKIYEAVINEVDLTTQELTSYGFDSQDLEELMNKRILTELEEGHYSLNKTDTLFLYGKKLIAENKNDQAILAFKKCVEINPKDLHATFQLFFSSVQNKDYDSALEYFDSILQNNTNHFYSSDYNFYLYLLSLITKLPDKYTDMVKNLKLEDIQVHLWDKRYADTYIHNKIRTLVFNKKLKQAKNLLVNFGRTNGLNTSECLIKLLLTQAIEIKQKNDSDIFNLVESKNYPEIVKNLELKQEIHTLDNYERAILFLTKELLNIQENNIIPEMTEFNSHNIFETIKHKDYKMALELVLQYSQNNRGINNETGSLLLLLENIFTEIEKLTTKKSDSLVKIDEIDECLQRSDFENGMKLIQKYLADIHKSDYNDLLNNYLKISILKEEKDFSSVIEMLNKISSNDFSLELKDYVQKLYNALSQGNIEESKIYLDIISKYNKKKDYVPVDILTNLVKEEEKTININTEVNKLVSDNLAKTYNKGIALLRPMSDEEIQAMHEIVEHTTNVTYFTIEISQMRRVVLMKKLDMQETLDMPKLLKSAYQSYMNKDYDNCINKYKKVLMNWSKNPKEFIFANIGLACIEKEDYATALDYLTVATALNKGGSPKYDFSELISQLSKEAPEEYEIYDDFMEEFNKPSDQNYGIENISDIIVLVSNGSSLNEACERIHLTEEEKNIVHLIFAKEWYTLGNYQIGDRYLKVVEKAPNKSKFTNSLLIEIRKNKPFYKNRVDNDYQSILVKTKKN